MDMVNNNYLYNDLLPHICSNTVCSLLDLYPVSLRGHSMKYL